MNLKDLTDEECDILFDAIWNYRCDYPYEGDKLFDDLYERLVKRPENKEVCNTMRGIRDQNRLAA